MPLEAEEDYLLFSWSDSKWTHLVHCEEIFDSELELHTPLWQAVLGLCCSASLLLFFLLWTLAPHDYVICCQARRLSGHTSPHGECACFFLEDSAPLEDEED